MDVEGERLASEIRGWGADLVGFGDIREDLAPELAHLGMAISIAIRHDPGDARIFYKGSLQLVTHHDPAVDYRLAMIQKRVVAALRAGGHRFFVIPPDTEERDTRFAARLYPMMTHKRAATCAGLGWIGKSGLVVNPAFGPRLSWATILTDAPLTPAEPIVASRCGTCTVCVDACPVGAIKGTSWRRGMVELTQFLDVSACTAQVADNHRLSGRYICGVCAAACPVGCSRRERHALRGGTP